jgi:cysteine synthase A
MPVGLWIAHLYNGARPATKRSRSASAMIGAVESILDAIGNTPLVRLRRCAPPNGAELWVKLEYRNPTGSMKDRMARAMIEGAERDGLISPGDTVVEYTGGSTGPALALVCRAKGYRALIVMADCFTEERFQLTRALGAELDVIPSVEGRPKVTAQDIDNMVARAAELAARPGHYATDQFHNPYIVPDHRDRLGREIWEQTEGRVTAFCQGLGTGSSLMGVSEALRPRGVFVQAHEPASSAAISGGERGPFLIQGWTGLVMPHWDASKVDRLEPIGDAEAVEMTARLAREEGVFAGISTGANVVGAHRLAELLGPDAVIVTLAVDSGFKYMSVSPYADA